MTSWKDLAVPRQLMSQNASLPGPGMSRGLSGARGELLQPGTWRLEPPGLGVRNGRSFLEWQQEFGL
ncbi:MAG: hypothetical protein PWP41_1538 [Moorella sp. (in: firmicutes)]|nr:hypothetical protein [Moorella sp. (in: firmicutes)]